MAERNRKHIILANAPIVNGNRGCTALTYSAIILIDAIAQANNFEYRIYLPDSGMRLPKETSIDINGKKITLYPIRHLIPLLKSLSFIHHITHPASWLKLRRLYKNIDCVFDLGQGDSFSDIYGNERFKTIDLIHRECRLLNKPYCFMPQTIGPFKNEKIKTQAIKSLNNAKQVMVRDEQSYEYTKNELHIKHVSAFTDLAFFLPFNRIMFDKEHFHIGINISALLWNNGYTGKNEFGLKLEYQNTVRNIIDYFLAQPDTIVHLIAHVVSSEHELENDYEISSQLYYEYKNNRLKLAPLFFTPIEAKNYISGMDFFIGARMHSTIAAFSSDVPVVPMSYSRKFEGLFCNTLNYKHVVNMQTSTEEDALQTITETYRNRADIKSNIQQINSEKTDKLKSELKESLNNFLQCY